MTPSPPSPDEHRARDQAASVARLAWHVLRARTGGPPSGGVMTVVLDDDGRVLLVKPRYRHTWCLPGGYLEPGELPAAGAAREVAEETGVVLVATPVELAQRIRPKHHDHLFLGTADLARSGRATTPWEIADTRWAAPSMLGEVHRGARLMLALVPGGIAAAIESERARAGPTGRGTR